MPDPTNISKVTATDIGTTFPYTITQDANIAGVTQDLWFTVTPTVSGLYGAYGLGSGGGYAPHTNFDDAADTFPVLGSSNKPIQYYLSAGTQSWWQCQNVGGNHSGASLTFSVQRSADLGIRAGDLFVQDDIDGFPGIAISPTTGVPTHAVFPFPGGEAGDSIPSGYILVEDQTLREVLLYDSTFTLIKTIADGATDTDLAICRNGARNAFYYAAHTAGTTVTVKKVNPVDGSILQTWTLSSTNGVSHIAASPDDTVLYLGGKGGSTDSAIAKWDLVNNVYLTDFAAAVAGHAFRINGLLCLTDGKVVASYRNNGSNTLLVRVYDSAGSVLVSNTYGTTPFGHHVGYAVDDPTSFWLWINESGNTRNAFHNVKVSDLSDITTFTVDTYEEGVNFANSPADRFGNSGSCPLFPLYLSSQSLSNSSGRRGIYVPTRGDAGSEGGGSNARFLDLNGYPSTSTGFSATVGGRIIHVMPDGPVGGPSSGLKGLGKNRAIYVPTVGIAGAEGDGRDSDGATVGIRRVVVYDGEGYTHR